MAITYLILNTDGGSRGNPGPAAAGIVLRSGDGEILKTASRYLGEATNNQAEYRALILGLETASNIDPSISLADVSLEILMDSELIVRHMQGKYKVRAKELIPLYEAAQDLVAKFGEVKFEHVVRELNTEADALVNQSLNRLGK